MAWDAGTRADTLVTARAVCSWYFQVCSVWFIHLDFDTAAWSGQFSVAAVPYPRPGNLYRKGLSWLVIVEAGKSRIRRLCYFQAYWNKRRGRGKRGLDSCSLPILPRREPDCLLRACLRPSRGRPPHTATWALSILGVPGEA